MYIRFVVPSWVNYISHEPMGVIRAAGSVQQKMSNEDQEKLDELFGWFNDFLSIPERFCKSASAKPHGEKKAISWFKDTAFKHISKAREIAGILECYNIQVEMLKSKNPGYVVYEDEYQVAAIPFS